jgi:hypothetical protein
MEENLSFTSSPKMTELMFRLDQLLELPIDESLKIRDEVMEQMWQEEQQSWSLLMSTFKEILTLEAKLRTRLNVEEREEISSRIAELKSLFLTPSQPPSRSTSNPEKLCGTDGLPLSPRSQAEKELLLKKLEEDFQINSPISSVRLIRQERLSFFYAGGKFHAQFRNNLFGHLLEMRVAARRHQLHREIVNHFNESLEEVHHRIQLAKEISNSLATRVNRLRNSLL